jgi:cyanophycin synthetase
MHMGTYFGHTVEHVAIELTQMAGLGVSFGKTRSAGPRGIYNLIVEYRSEQATRYLLAVAVELVQAILAGRPYSLEDKLDGARKLAARYDLGPSTQAIVDAAHRRGIPTLRLNDENLVQLGFGVHRRLIQASTTSVTSAVAVEIAGDKELTKALLRNAFIPVPDSYVVTSAVQAVEAWRELGGAVVVKPLNGSQGKGVSLNLNTTEQVKLAFDEALQFSDQVMVEHFLEGQDYRCWWWVASWWQPACAARLSWSATDRARSRCSSRRRTAARCVVRTMRSL